MAQSECQPVAKGRAEAEILGSPLVAVSFFHDVVPGAKEECEAFCSHVWNTMHDGRERLLDASSIKCPGARYVLRFDSDNTPPKKLIDELCAAHRADSPEEAEHMVRSLSRTYGTTSIRLSRNGEGDVYIAYLLPSQVMLLVQAYHRILSDTPLFACSSLAPVCGVAAAQAICTGKMCISFGCHDSRKQGGISDCDVVVGIPKGLLTPLTAIVDELQE